MPDAAVAHRVSQRQAHVFLSEHLLEALRAETTVERLVGNGILVAGVGHGRSLSGGPGAPGGLVRAPIRRRRGRRAHVRGGR